MRTKLISIIAFSFIGIISTAQAAVVIDAAETGGNVVLTGSGSANLTAWTFSSVINDFSRIEPSNDATAVVGPTPAVPSDRYGNPQNFAGPSGFGPGGVTNASSGTGDIFGILGRFNFNLPPGYVSGSPLSGSATYNSATFASLGMTPGSYTWTWGSGEDADSLTLNVGPDPGDITPTDSIPVPTMSIYGLILIMLGLLFVAYRHLRASAKRR